MKAPDAPRIEPLPPREWSPEMREALAVLLPENPRHPRPKREGGPKGLNALGMFAHHPALARAFNTFNGHILFMTSLSVRQRELVVLRVAHRRDAEYEWTQHVLMARDAGITDEEIERITAGPGDSGWSLQDQALLRAADELLDDALITDATWEVLAAELDDQQLIDLVFTVGTYDLVAMAFRTFGVQLDDDLLDGGGRK